MTIMLTQVWFIISAFVYVKCGDFYPTSTTLNKINSNTYYLNLKVNHSTSFQLILKLTEKLPKEIITEDFNLLIYKNNSYQAGYNLELLEGYDLSNPLALANGYFNAGNFYGKLRVDFKSYLIEKREYYSEYNIDDDSLNAIVFTEMHPNEQNTNKPKVKRGSAIYENKEKQFFRQFIGAGRICSLALVLDYSYLCLIHKGDLNSAVNRVKDAILFANNIFRSTDFDDDGIPDNIGFKIRQIIAIQSKKTFNLLPEYKKEHVQNENFITAFSHYQFIGEVCLGILFTSQTFVGNVLGVSYTSSPNAKQFELVEGGICEKMFYYGKKRTRGSNALLITAPGGQTNVTLDLALTHEIGHSFGAMHDFGECSGHIMNPTTQDGSMDTHYMFSRCSKDRMFSTIISKGFCLTPEKEPFCGNGIVEKGEQCDCGSARLCSRNKCCTPMGLGENSCTIKGECDPSQGLCCSKDCTLKDLSSEGLDCKIIQNNICPCSNNQTTCPCGIQGICVDDYCHSEECYRINLKECSCPPNLQDKCGICCFKNGKCSPSLSITEKMLKNNKTLIEEVRKKFNKTNPNVLHGTKKLFCENSTCVGLFFRETQRGGYCLQNGYVGNCSDDRRCVLETINNTQNIKHNFRFVIVLFLCLNTVY